MTERRLQRRRQFRCMLACAFLIGQRRAFPVATTTAVRRSLQQHLYGTTPATSFDDGERPYAITTPIYYVNDKPHIGHAYTSTGTYLQSSDEEER